jgi:hypothetical protein
MATRTLLEIWPEPGRAVARQAACQADILNFVVPGAHDHRQYFAAQSGND